MIYFKQANENITTLAELKEDVLYQEYLEKLHARANALHHFNFVPREYDDAILELEKQLVWHVSSDAWWTWESGRGRIVGPFKVSVNYIEKEPGDSDTGEYIGIFKNTYDNILIFKVLNDKRYPNGYRQLTILNDEGKVETVNLTLA